MTIARIEKVSFDDFSQDPLTECLRQVAGLLLQVCLEAEVAYFLNAHKHLTDERGKQRLVRNGYLPQKEIVTRLGKLTVRVPRVRDRLGDIRYIPLLIPPYRRRMSSPVSVELSALVNSIFKPYPIALLAMCFGGMGMMVPSDLVRLIEKMWSNQVRGWTHDPIVWDTSGVLVGISVSGENSADTLMVLCATASGATVPLAMCEASRSDPGQWCRLLRVLKERGLEVAPEKIAFDQEAFVQAFRTVYGQVSLWTRDKTSEADSITRAPQARGFSDLQTAASTTATIAYRQLLMSP